MAGEHSLIERVAAIAVEAPNAPAIVDADGRPTTRSTLVERMRAVANGLVAAGLQPGDRVLFAVRPSPEAIALLVALVDLGTVIVAAQLGVGDAVFAEQMRLVRPKWVIAESALLAAMNSRIARWAVRLRGGTLPALSSIHGAKLIRVGPWLPGTRAIALDAVVRGGGSHLRTMTMDPESPAFIVFTSGTTDAPKAVVHSRRSIEATLQIVAEQLAMRAGDVLLARDIHLILPALFVGATAVMPRAGSFSPSRTLDRIRSQSVSHMFEVTANCRALAEHLAERGERLPATFRQLLIGAAPVHAAFLSRVADVLPAGANACCTYGMTEMIPVAAISLADKLAYAGDGDIVGTPVRGAAVRVSESGELVVRGPNLFTGYLGHPPVAEHSTGDLARIDDEGRIVLLGRAKDMIIRREHNIYPELHEPVIDRIAGVRRSAMVGVYDPVAADERVVLAVEPEPGFEGDEFVRGIERALRRGPTRIDETALPDLIIVTPLPESGRSCKIDKAALRELAREKLA